MLANKIMKQDFVCKYCDRKFHKAGTLATHMCVKKQRNIDINSAGSRFGLRIFQRFYELTMHSKKTKTVEEFIDSPYYIDFVKFGNHLAQLKPIHIDKYIDYVIMKSVKLKDWTKDSIYELYIDDLVKKEPASSATERTITVIAEWCDKENVQFSNFFTSIHPGEASHLIKTGRISPWVLYLASSGENLMTRFNEEHGAMIGIIIDPGFWKKKFKKEPDEVEYISNLLAQAGL